MTVLSDQTLIELQHNMEDDNGPGHGLITPFNPNQVRKIGSHKIISRGLSSFGYDVALADDIQVFSNHLGGTIDPKRLDKSCLVQSRILEDDSGRFILLPPNSYLLGHTLEYFRIPSDILVLCLGKSTYARCGAIVNVTPIEPGFEGQVVIEISNSTSLPMRIYLGEGISQFIFLKGDRPCRISYADRSGKYQGQTGLTHSKV